MLRALLLLLLLANALLLAANLGVLPPLADLGAAQREPERLQRQHQPELLQLLSADAASAALREAAASAAETRAGVCLEAGPFAGADAQAAERLLREAGIADSAWQAIRSEGEAAYLIYMGRYTDRDQLQKKLEQVKRLRLDVEELRDHAELRPGLSLGRFTSRAGADAALARMAQRGLRNAKVVTLDKPQSQTLLRLAAVDSTLRARLAGLAWPKGGNVASCGAEAAAAGASAAPSAAPSASASAALAPAAAPVAPAALPGRASP